MQEWVESGRPEAGLSVVVGKEGLSECRLPQCEDGKMAVDCTGRQEGPAGVGGQSFTSSAQFDDCNFCAFCIVSHFSLSLRLDSLHVIY